MMKKGSLKPNGELLKDHEMATVILLTELGYDIEFIPKSNQKGIHNADIIMSGLEWEMKSPKGDGKWLIKNTIQKAAHQSENIIIDLRRIKISNEKCIQELEKQFQYSKRVKRLLVITKSKKVLEYKK